jgi:thiol:disulfide interchange protein
MARTMSFSVLALILISAMAAAQTDTTGAADSLKAEWVSSFADAQSKALDENRVILLDFYTDW